MDPVRETEDETSLRQTDTNENETEKLQTEKRGIQKQMTANERDYWWRLTHRAIQTKKRESKCEKDEDGESVTRECLVCKAEEEAKRRRRTGTTTTTSAEE